MRSGSSTRPSSAASRSDCAMTTPSMAPRSRFSRRAATSGWGGGGSSALRRACPVAAGPAFFVEPMAAPGVELILGLRRDPQFVPAVLVGLGGVLTEVLDDVAIRLAPVDVAAAESMLDSLRGAQLLRGVRGRPAVDRAAVVSMLVTLGRLGVDRPDILEIDLNPVVASISGAIAVDALVVLEGM